MSGTREVGRVVGLWRYPVKSLCGERLERLAFDERGVVGDRVWGLVDEHGKIASGKTTRRFRRVPGLLRHGARLGADGAPTLELADGRVLPPDDAVARELAGPRWRFARASRRSRTSTRAPSTSSRRRRWRASARPTARRSRSSGCDRTC